MSIKSTYYISRETAIRVVLAKIYELSDDKLAEVLEVLPGSTFRNYSIATEPSGSDVCIMDVNEWEWK